MKSGVISRVLLLGTFAIVGILAMQTYWVVSTWNINEAEFNQKVNSALYQVARSLADLSGSELPGRDIVKQRTTNYYIVNINAEIDANILEYLLQREFEKLSLNVDFEYAIYDCHTNQMEYGGYCNYSADKPRSSVLGNLPKDGESTYYFGVKFPNRSGYLLDKIQLSVFFSLVLFLTVIFFAYAMSVILRQKRLSEMQKDFINNMTHEFKTPLSTIHIAAGVFLNDPRIREDERLRRYADIIREQNQRLNDQVEKVLQIAKIEQGNFELKRETISLEEVLQPLLSGAAVRIEECGGELHTDLAATNVFIQADRLHLTNILYSLLDNAIKYGGRSPSITLSVRREAGGVSIAVSDRGPGIAKEHQPRVFDKFYRVPTGNVHNVKGFGLGLFYVKRICDAHGWRISLRSEPGRGTTVAIWMRALRQTVPAPVLSA